GVISNDDDVDGDDGNHLAAILVRPPVHGTLSWDPSGVFTYTPDTDFAGFDSFTYQDDDGHATNNLSNVATVTLKVSAEADPPPDQIVVNDESYTTGQNTPFTLAYP